MAHELSTWQLHSGRLLRQRPGCWVLLIQQHQHEGWVVQWWWPVSQAPAAGFGIDVVCSFPLGNQAADVDPPFGNYHLRGTAAVTRRSTTCDYVVWIMNYAAGVTCIGLELSVAVASSCTIISAVGPSRRAMQRFVLLC